MHYLTLSVHELVDFLLRKGSIDNRIYNQETMNEGSRIHLRYQQMQEGNYDSEVPLSVQVEVDDILYTLEGRADGVIKTDNLIIIDEIKSTVDDLENFYNEQGPWHLGQALCYAFMYADQYKQDSMGVRLTYISQIDNSKLIKDFVFDYETLKKRVYDLFKEYSGYYLDILAHKEERNHTASWLSFPYKDFRDGQKEASKYVYKIALDGGLFFLEAPTGIGKTMATLFPAIKTFASEKNEKIFYLSAKAQAKEVAHNALKVMVNQGLNVTSIVLSSKEAMCQSSLAKCNPDECPFAKDYYTKINGLVRKIISNEKCIDQKMILKYALEENICPFEFQLDVSTLSDIIICDYNYLFDPIAKLKRFFEEGKVPYFALIDEAHNLSERAKDMFTVWISLDALIRLRNSLTKVRLVAVKKYLRKLINYIVDNTQDLEAYTQYDFDFPKDFYDQVNALYEAMQEALKKHSEHVNDEFMECFRMVMRFIKIREYLDETFMIYIENKDDIRYYLRSIDASKQIKRSLSLLRGAVLFSATLTPLPYYIKTLGGNDDTPFLRLPSPFSKDNVCLLVRYDISTKYKDRAYSYGEIAQAIKAMVKGKVGNYLVFFSSYQYLNEVRKVYVEDDEYIIEQEPDMDNFTREKFLNAFKEDPKITTIGFAVLGGAFSEGIDLVSSRLIGACIVGVGLPMISFERDLIKQYYDDIGEDGYSYAYVNPGKNKVMQAAGRVIRSASDKGVVLLIDSRFKNKGYNDLFKGNFASPIFVNSNEEIRQYLTNFWE